MAITAALATIELLEKILLNLNIIDITKAKRVSRVWRNCINRSTLLQYKLFRKALSASEAPSKRKYSRYSVQPVSVNPLLHNVIQIRHSEISGSSIDIKPSKDRRRLQQRPIHENVLKRPAGSDALDGLYERPIVLDSEGFYRRSWRVSYTRHLNDSGDDIPGLVRRQNPHVATTYQMGNWSSMLATQPPVETLSLRCDSMGGMLGAVKVQAADGRGVTLRDIAEAAAEFYRMCGQKHSDGFRFDMEMSVYQPIEIERQKDGAFRYSADGRARWVDSDEAVGFQRAWKTNLKCNLG